MNKRRRQTYFLTLLVVNYCVIIEELECFIPFTLLQQFDGFIDVIQGHVVSDELIQLYFLVQEGLNHFSHAVLTLKA